MANNRKDGDLILKIIALVIILAIGLLGLVIMDLSKGILWLTFCIVAYPVVLSFTVGKRMGANDLITLYKVGLTQIPVLGQLFLDRISLPRTPEDTDQ